MDNDLTIDLAKLSLQVYQDLSLTPGLPNGWYMVGLPKADGPFFAQAYQRASDGLIVVAFRGSDGLLDWTGANAALANPNKDWSNQFRLALDYVNEVFDATGATKLLVTGHSLGGSLAQVAAAMFDLDGVAFDPAGALNVIASKDFDDLKTSPDFHGRGNNDNNDHTPADFTNYVVQGSVVSHANIVLRTDDHLGAVVPIDKDKDFTELAQAVIVNLAPQHPIAALGAEVAFQIYYLHDMAGILKVMEARVSDQSASFALDSLGTAVDLAQPLSYAQLLADATARISPLLQSGDLTADSALGSNPYPAYFGSTAADLVTGNNAPNEIHGGAGGDNLIGFGGDDLLYGDDGDDLIVAALGNDTIYPGAGSDTVFGGSGDDRVFSIGLVTAFSTDIVDGGAGVDTLDIDYSALTSTGRYEVTAHGGATTTLDANSSLSTIRDALAKAESFAIAGGSAGGVRTEFVNVERVNLTLGFGQSLVIFQGGSQYKAAGTADTFYADWSAATAAISWDNQPWGPAQLVNGVSVQGMERLLLTTGSGNDTLTNLGGVPYLSNDEIHTGSGDDTVDAGMGSDLVDAGPGNDTITVVGLAPFATDKVDGGTGVDTLNIDYSALVGIGAYEAVMPSGGKVVLDANSSLATIHEALASATAFAVTGGSTSSYRTEFVNIERVNLTTGIGQALVIDQHGSSYKAGGASNTFYADWSAATTPIGWSNEPWHSQVVNGVSLQGMSRLLLTTGSGNDSVSNTETLDFSDEIHTGGGDDTVNAGRGSDVVDTGPGNDTIAVVGLSNFTTDRVDGGPGVDTLNIDYSSLVGNGAYEVVTSGGGKTLLDSNSTWASIHDALASATGFVVLGGSTSSYRTEFVNVEHINLKAGSGVALVVYQDGTEYKAFGSAQDTFYADWSSATRGITWDNQPAAAQVVNGTSLQGMERLLLATGSGNDRLTNVETLTNDEFRTGAGDDYVDAGPGNDVVDAGSGNDIVVPGRGVDQVHGGPGLDQVKLAGNRAGYVVSRGAASISVRERSSNETDMLDGVERLAFDDTRLAFDLDANAGTAAKVLGALFGKASVTNPTYTGIALGYLDAGMSYESLVSLAVSHPAFIALAGSSSNESFVRLVYRNVVGVEPGAQDLATYVHLLEDGSFTRTSLAMLACETELNRVNVDLVGLAQTGLEYLPPQS